MDLGYTLLSPATYKTIEFLKIMLSLSFECFLFVHSLILGTFWNYPNLRIPLPNNEHILAHGLTTN
jgi:hypothetical protein